MTSTKVVATVEHSQRNELPDEFVGLFPGSPLYVMSKEGGEWRMVACQNAEVLS